MITKLRQSGFTMIELMVVMLIMTTVIGLVGSLTIDRLDKTKSKTEVMSLKNTIKELGYRAFVTSNKHELRFDGKALTIFVSQNTHKKIQFEYLFFQPQSIVLNTMGYPIQTHLNVIEGTNNLQIELLPLFSYKRDVVTQVSNSNENNEN